MIWFKPNFISSQSKNLTKGSATLTEIDVLWTGWIEFQDLKPSLNLGNLQTVYISKRGNLWRIKYLYITIGSDSYGWFGDGFENLEWNFRIVSISCSTPTQFLSKPFYFTVTKLFSIQFFWPVNVSKLWKPWSDSDHSYPACGSYQA